MFFDPLEDKERKATIKTKMPCAEHLRMRENSIIINNCFLGKKRQRPEYTVTNMLKV